MLTIKLQFQLLNFATIADHTLNLVICKRANSRCFILMGSLLFHIIHCIYPNSSLAYNSDHVIEIWSVFTYCCITGLTIKMIHFPSFSKIFPGAPVFLLLSMQWYNFDRQIFPYPKTCKARKISWWKFGTCDEIFWNLEVEIF